MTDHPPEEPAVERLPHCQYGVPAASEEGVEDCGEPASFRIRWSEQQGWFYACERHLPLTGVGT